MLLPEPIESLIVALERLPGIGPKTASRLAFFLLRASDDVSGDLAEALTDLKSKVDFCQDCFNITAAGRERCEICDDPRRDGSVLCVVEDPLDVLSFERTGGFKGRYHVLQGLLSPIDGIEADDIKIRPLVERVSRGDVQEVILATNPSMEGDTTAQYIGRQLKPLAVRVTRLGLGLPVGGDLEYADQNTLLRALLGRQELP